jgi:hypothetical protein
MKSTSYIGSFLRHPSICHGFAKFNLYANIYVKSFKSVVE